MIRNTVVKTIISTSTVCALALFPVVAASATAPPSAAGAALASDGEGEGAGAIMMGVAVAAATQSVERQQVDRAALRKRLQHLLDNEMFMRDDIDHPDDMSRIVRIVFDVGPDGSSANVRVGKRSGNGFTDRAARAMVVRFKGLPGGERLRVCTVLQYGRSGQDVSDAVFVKARKDATDSAKADLLAGRDGPTYDRRGRIVT